MKKYQCGCSKKYISNSALYTHIKLKHNGKAPSNTIKPSVSGNKGRPSKSIQSSSPIDPVIKVMSHPLFAELIHLLMSHDYLQRDISDNKYQQYEYNVSSISNQNEYQITNKYSSDNTNNNSPCNIIHQLISFISRFINDKYRHKINKLLMNIVSNKNYKIVEDDLISVTHQLKTLMS